MLAYTSSKSQDSFLSDESDDTDGSDAEFEMETTSTTVSVNLSSFFYPFLT
jgi:hypothetical protein